MHFPGLQRLRQVQVSRVSELTLVVLVSRETWCCRQWRAEEEGQDPGTATPLWQAQPQQATRVRLRSRIRRWMT
jgi:hypothetical protein